jgi:hypothetical protein
MKESCEPRRMFVRRCVQDLLLGPKLGYEQYPLAGGRSIFEARKDHFRGQGSKSQRKRTSDTPPHTRTEATYLDCSPRLVSARIVSLISRFLFKPKRQCHDAVTLYASMNSISERCPIESWLFFCLSWGWLLRWQNSNPGGPRITPYHSELFLV